MEEAERGPAVAMTNRDMDSVFPEDRFTLMLAELDVLDMSNALAMVQHAAFEDTYIKDYKDVIIKGFFLPYFSCNRWIFTGE